MPIDSTRRMLLAACTIQAAETIHTQTTRIPLSIRFPPSQRECGKQSIDCPARTHLFPFMANVKEIQSCRTLFIHTPHRATADRQL